MQPVRHCSQSLTSRSSKPPVKMVSDKFELLVARDAEAEAIPLRGITTLECVHALITGWIARFGVPGDISSDRGSQFTSSLWSDIAARLGVKLHHTSAYHPQANEMIERFHWTRKTALKARLTGPNWVEELPWVLLGLRTTPKEDLGYSSAELVYDEPLTIPVDRIKPAFFDPFQSVILAKPPPRGRSPAKIESSLTQSSIRLLPLPPSISTPRRALLFRRLRKVPTVERHSSSSRN
ncbi:hypothetical protein RRG08_035514 [Elysia crispata]|uniref:Integrase catalytic domain-containing protein n=1 Tax=Elysia crispata TaxID=231223 RepID=A0AAE1A434_9GAST|nr:hypothetical protein RRG08_035514 [Elysia crispata]